jgi:hypothetical protein
VLFESCFDECISTGRKVRNEHNMAACIADQVCVSVCFNWRTAGKSPATSDLDEVSYECCAAAGQPRLIFLSFVQRDKLKEW